MHFQMYAEKKGKSGQFCEGTLLNNSKRRKKIGIRSRRRTRKDEIKTEIGKNKKNKNKGRIKIN